MNKSAYPRAIDPKLVGEYEATAHAGGGYTWDAVLEYRVWMHPERGAPDHFEGNDYYYAFETYEEALEYSNSHGGSEEPLALVLQEEHINEPEPGKYEHVKKERLTEWPPEFLTRPKRDEFTIPDFLSTEPIRELYLVD